MKKLNFFKSSLLMSAVALSVLSSPANAVSEDVINSFLQSVGMSDALDANQ